MLNALRMLWQSLRALWQRATNGSVWRQRFFAGGAALGLLLIIFGVVLASMAPAATPKQLVVARVQATATETATATATSTPKPTATPKPKPVPKTPPPPPMPAPPSQPPTPVGSGYTGGPVTNDSIFSDFCSTPTPTAPTATDTPMSATATATGSATGTSTALGHAGLAMPTSCLSCPSFTSGYNSSQSQIKQALATAAATYNLPIYLLKAVAWQESSWHEDVYTCDGGIGLMQIQYYTYPWLNQKAVPECGLGTTSYDPYTLQGNAYLGAKLLKYLSCLYSYWGNQSGTSLSNPGTDSSAYNYQQASLQYPDTQNADGSTNANSLCAADFNQYAYYPALPSTTSAPWSCPFNATSGDNTLLDLTLSAYNEGATTLYYQGIINQWYVNGVESYIPQFASGALP